MRRMIGLAVAMMLVAGVAAAGGEGCPMAKKEKCDKGKTCTIGGEVTAVDAEAGKLSVKDEKGEVTEFTIPAEAKVIKAGKKDATLADVAAGDKVKLICSDKDGTKTVVHVKVMDPKKGKKGEKGKKPAAK